MPETVEIVFQKVKDDNKIPNNCLVWGLKASISFCCIILFFFFTFDFRRPNDLHLCLICGDVGVLVVSVILIFWFLLMGIEQ